MFDVERVTLSADTPYIVQVQICTGSVLVSAGVYTATYTNIWTIMPGQMNVNLPAALVASGESLYVRSFTVQPTNGPCNVSLRICPFYQTVTNPQSTIVVKSVYVAQGQVYTFCPTMPLPIISSHPTQGSLCSAGLAYLQIDQAVSGGITLQGSVDWMWSPT